MKVAISTRVYLQYFALFIYLFIYFFIFAQYVSACFSTIKMLYEKALPYFEKQLFLSGILQAVRVGDISELTKILQEKDKLGYKNFNVNGSIYESPLHLAVFKGDYDMCKMLVDSNADVNKILENQTPLNIAEEMDNFLIANLLQKKRGRDRIFYRNPLHIAVKECDYHLCEFHLKHINVNSVDRKNRTALHVAVMFSPDDICKLLVRNGADVYARDSYNDTPLQLAFYLGRHELRQIAIQEFSHYT